MEEKTLRDYVKEVEESVKELTDDGYSFDEAVQIVDSAGRMMAASFAAEELFGEYFDDDDDYDYDEDDDLDDDDEDDDCEEITVSEYYSEPSDDELKDALAMIAGNVPDAYGLSVDNIGSLRIRSNEKKKH